VIIPILPHAIETIRGDATDCARWLVYSFHRYPIENLNNIGGICASPPRRTNLACAFHRYAKHW
jgi:hypothetical protein